MPYYRYECDGCGKQFEQFFTMADYRKRVECECGKEAFRVYGMRTRMPGNWPLESEALACHPAQVDYYAKDAMKRGVPTDFNPRTGAPILTSPEHRRRYCRAYGYYDRNAGYGDPTRD